MLDIYVCPMYIFWGVTLFPTCWPHLIIVLMTSVLTHFGDFSLTSPTFISTYESEIINFKMAALLWLHQSSWRLLVMLTKLSEERLIGIYISPIAMFTLLQPKNTSINTTKKWMIHVYIFKDAYMNSYTIVAFLRPWQSPEDFRKLKRCKSEK